MKNKKVILIISTLFLMIFLGGCYIVWQKKSCPENNMSVSVSKGDEEWVMFNNPNFSYGFSYPSNLSRQKTYIDDLAFKDDENKIYDTVTIRSYEGKQNLYNSVEDWYARSQEKTFLWIRRVKIDGNPAMVVRQRDFDKTSSSEIIMVVKNNILYNIALKGFGVVEFDRFLDSFKFLD